MVKLPHKSATVSCLWLIVISALLWGCSKKSSKYSDSSVFRYNEHKNINSLDPAFAKDLADIWGVNQVFNGLVQMDDQLNVVPAIASSWTVSDSGKIYTFNLKSKVHFHKHYLFGADSTRAVTARDFEYSFERLIDPKVASPGSWVFQKVDSFKALNDSTFQINLKQPFPAFLGLLTMKYCSVVPREIVDYFGSEFRSNPIGTGPFYFKRWDENTKLVFRKNLHYFEKDTQGISLPYLQAVSGKF